MDASLYGGFTGIGWTMAHLREQLVDADDEDPNVAIDEVLLAYLDRSPWTVEYDLISGLVGLGVYALERLPRASARECLERIVQRLTDLAERHADGGITWPTPPELLPSHQREKCPNGYYNLGLAHGVPGVIAFLGQVCVARIGGEKARALLDGGVTWLLKQKLSATNRSTFPAWVTPDNEPGDCRLAWCYGDVGVAAALLVAARAVNSPDWELEAIEIARRAARRRRSTAGVKDAALCHGAAGLGHIFNRFFQATGEASFRQAARYWFDHTLDLRITGEGGGGFSAYRAAYSGHKEYWESEIGFLEGAAGIALALLAAAADVEPKWDRLLLVSISGANRPCWTSKSKVHS
jgi:hypothetical protein